MERKSAKKEAKSPYQANDKQDKTEAKTSHQWDLFAN